MGIKARVSEDKFPKIYDRERGIQDGFIDGAKLSEIDLGSTEGAGFRIRKAVSVRLAEKGFPYFAGYVRGRELFSIYLGGSAK